MNFIAWTIKIELQMIFKKLKIKPNIRWLNTNWQEEQQFETVLCIDNICKTKVITKIKKRFLSTISRNNVLQFLEITSQEITFLTHSP